MGKGTKELDQLKHAHLIDQVYENTRSDFKYCN